MPVVAQGLTLAVLLRDQHARPGRRGAVHLLPVLNRRVLRRSGRVDDSYRSVAITYTSTIATPTRPRLGDADVDIATGREPDHPQGRPRKSRSRPMSAGPDPDHRHHRVHGRGVPELADAPRHGRAPAVRVAADRAGRPSDSPPHGEPMDRLGQARWRRSTTSAIATGVSEDSFDVLIADTTVPAAAGAPSSVGATQEPRWRGHRRPRRRRPAAGTAEHGCAAPCADGRGAAGARR